MKQFKYESDAWKRRLEGLLWENAFLKNQLAESLNEGITGRDSLEAAEQYLNSFLRQDEIIGLIRHDITVYDKLLANGAPADRTLVETIEQKNQAMRRELQMLDITFNTLKLQFNNFLYKA